jgi:hypothetical protein
MNIEPHEPTALILYLRQQIRELKDEIVNLKARVYGEPFRPRESRHPFSETYWKLKPTSLSPPPLTSRFNAFHEERWSAEDIGR